MTINLSKQTKMLLAVAGVAVLGLYFWSKRKKTASFAGRKTPSPAFATITSGPNAGQVVFFGGPRGAVYLPVGTVPFQSNGIWYFTSAGENYPLTGPGALGQTGVNEVV